MGRTRVDVDLVITGTVVADEAERAREDVEELGVNLSRCLKAVKRAIGSETTFERP